MEIKDILALANAGFTAEQINQLNNQAQPQTFPQAQPQTFPQAQPQAFPQVQPQAQPQTFPQAQPQAFPQVMQINPYGVPFMGQLTPAPMPPVPTTNTGAGQTTEAPAPNVPGNPSPEQLAGQLAQAQATNLNGVTVSPAQKVSIEDKLQDHYRALMGVTKDKKGE